jgi:hypothetical protein
LEKICCFTNDLDPDLPSFSKLDPDLDPHSLKKLDPQDPLKGNADPKHCWYGASVKLFMLWEEIPETVQEAVKLFMQWEEIILYFT